MILLCLCSSLFVLSICSSCVRGFVDLFGRDGRRRNAAVRFLETDPTARQCDEMGDTPLHFAASEDCVEVAELLLAAGATVDRQDIYGHTPLYAAKRNRIGVAKVLLAAGASHP